MEKKYAVFLDIDGTLVSGINKIHPDNLKTISEVRSLGHYVFLNTGRALSWVVVPKLVNLDNFDGIISGMGSNVLMHGKTLSENLIDKNTVYEVIKYFLNTKHCFFVSGVDTGFILNPLPIFKPFPFVPITTPEDYLNNYSDKKIQKIEIFGKHITDEEKGFLSQYLDVYDHKAYIEASPKGITKSGAMIDTAAKLGIPKECVIAMGDSVNDMDMLKNAGISVAMGNALPEVKEFSDFISIPCDKGGVAYALRKIILEG